MHTRARLECRSSFRLWGVKTRGCEAASATRTRAWSRLQAVGSSPVAASVCDHRKPKFRPPFRLRTTHHTTQDTAHTTDGHRAHAIDTSEQHKTQVKERLSLVMSTLLHTIELCRQYRGEERRAAKTRSTSGEVKTPSTSGERPRHVARQAMTRSTSDHVV